MYKGVKLELILPFLSERGYLELDLALEKAQVNSLRRQLNEASKQVAPNNSDETVEEDKEEEGPE